MTKMATNPRIRIHLACLTLALGLLLAFAATARAGTYSVLHCNAAWGANSHGADWYATSGAFSPRDRCAAGDYVGLDVVGHSGAYDQGAWIWTAPYGAQITYAAFDASMGAQTGGNFSQLYLENIDGSGQHMIHNGATPGAGFRTVQGGAPRDRVVARIVNTSPVGGFSYTASYFKNLRFEITDYAAPSVFDLEGSTFQSGWISSGVYGVGANAFDYGSGVSDTYLYGNGVLVNHKNFPCNYLDGAYFGDFRPCGGGVETRSSHWALDLGGAPFSEGTNTVSVCAVDLASTRGTPNQGCASQTVRIDRTSPTSPGPLQLQGGEDWRATNGFNVAWVNPAQAGDVAPLATTHFRLTGPDGYNSGDQEISLTNALNGLSVPKDGEYTLSVWAEDAAGNANAASARSVQLRFDDTVPASSEARFNGWVRRADFPYEVDWNQLEPTDFGPSGIAGYAVSITDQPGSDPCATPAHPASACSSREITNGGGVTDVSEIVEDAPQGQSWVHVVPVSGAGVKAAEVTHTTLPVDKTDPVSRIEGVPTAEWVNRDVGLTVVANDGLSGMSPSSAFSLDPQPRTTIAVDGTFSSEPDSSITTTIAAEGVHDVRFFARDLAGNENNGQSDGNIVNSAPGIATVRIDKTLPAVAFQNAESVADPTLVKAPVQDALSGVASGLIELQRLGPVGESATVSAAAEWLSLPTKLVGDHLEARVPDDLDAGRYRMRASATDAAGNTATAGTRQNGEPMEVDLPLKTSTELTAGLGRRQMSSRTLAYGRPSVVRGHLQTAQGTALAEREVTVTELRGPGARARRLVRTVKTDSHGDFQMPLSAGPTRVVSVTYSGDSRYRAAKAADVRMRVRGKVLRFLAPRSISETGTIVFRGRIGALGVKLGKLGKWVELQYLKGNAWKTIETGRARKRGAFKVRYPLRSDYTQPVAVSFRLRIPKERKWPYVGGAVSRKRTVIIQPH